MIEDASVRSRRVYRVLFVACLVGVGLIVWGLV